MDWFAKIRRELKIHSWIMAVLAALGLGNLFLSFQILSRLQH
jgi:hypothetical protein